MCMQRASPLPGNTHVEPECIESLVCPRTERACTQPLLLGKGTIELIQIPLGTQHVFCQVTFSLNHWRLSLAAQATISSCTNNSCPFCSSSLLILMLLKLSQLFLEPLRPKYLLKHTWRRGGKGLNDWVDKHHWIRWVVKNGLCKEKCGSHH